MNTIKRIIFTSIFVLMVSVSFASGLILAGNVSGANIEKYNENTHSWDSFGGFPLTLSAAQYEYVQVRVSAPGYQAFNAGYDVRWSGTQKYYISMEPENLDPNGLSLFGIEGTVVSKSGKNVTEFIVWARNLNAIKAGKTGQLAEDENPVQSGGWYTATLGDLAVEKGVSVGDKLFIGVFTADKLRCLGYKTLSVKQENIDYGGVQLNLTIR